MSAEIADSMNGDLDGPLSVDLGLLLHVVLELQSVVDLSLFEVLLALQPVGFAVFAELVIEMIGLYWIGLDLLRYSVLGIAGYQNAVP